MFLELTNIKKYYLIGKNKVSAINDITIEIKKGEFLSIAGKSGSGKTTLLNIIACIDFVDSGYYIFDGQDITKASELLRTRLRKRDIGFIFQTFNLVPVLSAYENIEYPLLLENNTPKERKEKVEYWLNKVGLYDKKTHRPNELSGGQRQRVAIARALVKMPKLILADEPTASLDTKTGTSIIELMQNINQEQQTTFIFSSHDDLVIKHANRVIYMQDGYIVEGGRS